MEAPRLCRRPLPTDPTHLQEMSMPVDGDSIGYMFLFPKSGFSFGPIWGVLDVIMFWCALDLDVGVLSCLRTRMLGRRKFARAGVIFCAVCRKHQCASVGCVTSLAPTLDMSFAIWYVGSRRRSLKRDQPILCYNGWTPRCQLRRGTVF